MPFSHSPGASSASSFNPHRPRAPLHPDDRHRTKRSSALISAVWLPCQLLTFRDLAPSLHKLPRHALLHLPTPLLRIHHPRGIRIHVTPSFLPNQSGEGEFWQGRRYVFSYHIKISNEGTLRAELISRLTWTIVDAEGERSEVRGEGVVGHQPDLAPGQAFEYTSYCPLQTPWGTMEGEFQMIDERGEPFEAIIARFYLVSTPTE